MYTVTYRRLLTGENKGRNIILYSLTFILVYLPNPCDFIFAVEHKNSQQNF